MPKKPVLQRILDERLIAVLRLQRTEHIESIVQALVKGGITIIEITLNSQRALESINRIAKEFPQCLVGAGTVIGYDAAVAAIESGAKFLASPVTDLDMLAVAQQTGIVSMAGALTPTEAWQATQAGADFVKLFPLAGLGPDYLRAIRGPLNDIRFIPTNGVTTDTIADYFAAGAVAVGLGSALVNDRDVEIGDLSILEERTRAAVAAVGTIKRVKS
jgi:2-dehydro-3-deoxyphosphogluconate aldolase/(4S)-4-hydroxy-2-oxoglutarate aldolase